MAGRVPVLHREGMGDTRRPPKTCSILSEPIRFLRGGGGGGRDCRAGWKMNWEVGRGTGITKIT